MPPFFPNLNVRPSSVTLKNLISSHTHSVLVVDFVFISAPDPFSSSPSSISEYHCKTPILKIAENYSDPK